MEYLIFFTILIGVIFGVIMCMEPRTLWSGAVFVVFMIQLAALAIVSVAEYSEWILWHEWIYILLAAAAILAFLFIVLFPALLILMFLVEGIRVLKKEGKSFSNALSLLFALLLTGYLVGWPLVGQLRLGTWGSLVYISISEFILYLLMLMTMYVLSALLNLFHLRKRKRLDYIVVLGCGVSGDRVTPLLAGRIEKGLQLLRYNPRARLILSGGQGEGETIPEGEAMAAYAQAQGIDMGRVIVEKRSANTRENLLFSRELMEGQKPRIALVTTGYHVFRALILARKCGIRCIGYGARTKWYFTLNALIREFVGYLKLSWKLHTGVLAGMVLLFLVLMLVL